ncbi:MAG: hypothetical protein M3R02_09810 [Chloroflexota bacterium]|nr:hypothetical protein [Chloroflexota bacterium]
MRPSFWPTHPWSRRRLIGAVALALGGVAGNGKDPRVHAARSLAGSPCTAGGLAFTHGRADGNRLVGGRGTFPIVAPLDLALGGRPRWVVAASEDGTTSVWVVVLADGQAQAFRVTASAAEPIPMVTDGAVRPPEMPPLLRVRDGRATLVAAPAGSHPSPLAPPLPLGDGLALIDADGALLVWGTADRAQAPSRFPLAAPRDARLVTDGAGRVALLTGRASDRYDHGVLGDAVEATGFAIVDVSPPELAQQVHLPPPDVIEGLAPLWADLDGDGAPEIVVTVSSASDGGRLVVYSGAGERLAVGPGFGRADRWRQPLAVAPFGPAGEIELAAVRTPHIGGVVEFWRLEGTELRPVAELPGYTSHVLGSRNLDLAIGGDFDGDGQPELVLPSQDRTRLGAIRRIERGPGAVVAWDLPLGGVLATNMAAVGLGGGMALGNGREDGVLRLWLPA